MEALSVKEENLILVMENLKTTITKLAEELEIYFTEAIEAFINYRQKEESSSPKKVKIENGSVSFDVFETLPGHREGLIEKFMLLCQTFTNLTKELLKIKEKASEDEKYPERFNEISSEINIPELWSRLSDILTIIMENTGDAYVNWINPSLLRIIPIIECFFLYHDQEPTNSNSNENSPVSIK